MLHRTELPAGLADGLDLLTLHRNAPGRYPFLLESVAPHPQAGRYDILFGFPGAALELPAVDPRPEDFFAVLDAQLRAARCAPEPELPFCGGWFLLLGYEAARAVEPRLRLPASPHALPDALAVRCTGALIRDRLRGCTELVSEDGEPAIAQMLADCRAAARQAPQRLESPAPARIEEDAPHRFLEAAARISEYLRAGDVFQVNLSRAWQAQLHAPADPAHLYASLRQANPAPFAGLAVWRGGAVLSSSPERLASVDGDRVQTRPIAGTHPRLADAEADAGQAGRMLGSLKERAEHLMLIDLERNDLGRICIPGSVRVDELMVTERYAHVHHIVSNVGGRLRPGATAVDVLRAVFPGGTITGCPKVRAMEIIAELEGVGRGPYTGAMGYVSRCGRMDTNILIRSLVCEGRRVSLRAGAGIVADSRPEAELAETRAKARGMLLALGAA
ncbi:MAG: aminodeoxychorismate synthase component I [Nevskia sp.]|nr:aminodeoxychorismate synthase component I [Nevskia sp.]